MTAMVTTVTMINMATMVALFTMFPWGIPNHSDNFDVTDAIREGQILVKAPELSRYAYYIS
jgi:hypothetical protein